MFSPSSPRALVGLVGAGLLAGVLAGCGAASSAPPPPPASVGTRINGPLADRITSLPLQDERGRTTTLGSFHGKVVVMYAAMTSCTSDCPLDTANIVTAARAADAAGLTKKVEFLSVTIDPGRDSAQRLAAYRKLYAAPGQLPNWELLTGSRRNITALWKYFGVYWRKVPNKKPLPRDWQTGKPLTYDIQHADEVFLIDRNGHERLVISGRAHVGKSDAVPATLRGFLDEEGRHNLKHPDGQAWTPDALLKGVSWLTGKQVTAPGS